MRLLRFTLSMSRRLHKLAHRTAPLPGWIALSLLLVVLLTASPLTQAVFAQQATVPPPPPPATDTPTVDVSVSETPDDAVATAAVTQAATDAATSPAPTTARATSSPTPLPEYVLTSESGIVYPTALASYFEFAQPKTEFVDATLMLRQEGWSQGPISVDYASLADEVDGITRLTYIWDITPNDPPRVFEDVELTWTFVQQDGSQVTFTHTVYYADPRVTWEVIFPSDGQIELAFPSGRAAATPLTLGLEASYALLQTSTGQEDFSPTIRMVVYDGSLTANPCQTNASGESISRGTDIIIELPCNPDSVTENIYTPSGFRVIQLSPSSAETLQTATIGVLFDEFYDRLWADAGTVVPAWFREGLKKFYTPGIKATDYELSRSAARAGGALRRMETVPTDEAGRTQWSAQSYGMVLYMAEQLGVDGLFGLARSIGPENTLAGAYEAASRTPLSGLISAWNSWLFTIPAQTAYNYSPYLPTTPTPSRTPTHTPTITRTPTPTSTPTITPTITGVLSATPRPATAVPPSITPSITSRPAGSLPTPIATPLPTTEIVEVSDEGQRTVTLLIGFGLMALGILIAVAALFLRNRSLNPGGDKT